MRRGDVALFSWSGSTTTADHAGLIAEVGGNAVRTIEGNTAIGDDNNGGEVMERVRKFDTIIGVCRPAYPGGDDSEYNLFKTHMQRYLSIAGTGDVHSDWAEEAVQAITERGIIKGDGVGNYGWQVPVTREAAAQIAYNMLNM
jgi:hypothetical protein